VVVQTAALARSVSTTTIRVLCTFATLDPAPASANLRPLSSRIMDHGPEEWTDARGSVAPGRGAQAHLVALGVREDPERRGALGAEQRATRVERRRQSTLGDLDGHVDVDMDAI